MKRDMMILAVIVLSVLLAGCSKIESGPRAARICISQGLSTPESVLHDPASDLYLVSNINGSPFGEDGAGYIARFRPDGSLESARWIDGQSQGVILKAPKGMAIVGDVLYVADIDAVRKFDRKSGKPLGSISVSGASFLNDLTAAADGTVFVSDTGLGKGFSESGTDAIYAVGAKDEVRVVVKDKSLGQPNGLLADGDGVLFVGWASGALSRVGRDGKVTEIARLPKKQLDGIVKEKDGACLISSWEGSAIYRVTEAGEVSTAVPDVQAPADLGYDAKRNRLLLPYFEKNRVDLVSR